MKDQSFVINYLTDGLRNGTAFGSPDLTVKGRCQTEPSGPEILSGKGMCLYEMGFPQHETVEKVFTAARAAGLSPESVYCGEMFVSVFYGGEITDIKTYKIVISAQMTE